MSAQPGKAIKKTERRQRRYPRFRVEFPVKLTVFSGAERQQIEAHVRDLSVAGIGILIAAELMVGEVAVLSFCLPGTDSPWSVRAVLRQRRGYHYGFEFLSLSGEQNSALSSYLPSQERADGDADIALRAQ